MFCFVIADKSPDDEGIPAIHSSLGPMPLIGADLRRVDSLMPHAQSIADMTGQTIRVYKFTHKEQIGEINPQGHAPFTLPERCADCQALLCGSLTNHKKGCRFLELIEQAKREL